MKKYIINTSLAILFGTIMFCYSCGNNRSKEETVESATEDSTQREEGIAEVTEGQMKTVGIEMGTIEQQNLTSAIRASGRLTVPPQNKAVVNALVGGVIKKITVSEGEEVSKGKVVATIENPDFIRLQQDYLTSKDNIVYLEQEYERQKSLKEADAGIGKVYQQASSNYLAEQSRQKTLEAQLHQIHIDPSKISANNIIREIPVIAPIDGTVGKINLSIGTFTDASSPLMEIVNNRNMHCDLRLFENDITKVRIGQPVRFTVSGLNDRQVSGKVFGINKSLETENKSVIVHALVNNEAAQNLIEGMYVTALIETGKAKVPAVKKDAIVKVGDRSFILVYAGTEEEGRDSTVKYRFRMTEVMPGVEELGYVQVSPMENLSADTKIVTKGAFYIWSGMQTHETDDL